MMIQTHFRQQYPCFDESISFDNALKRKLGLVNGPSCPRIPPAAIEGAIPDHKRRRTSLVPPSSSSSTGSNNNHPLEQCTVTKRPNHASECTVPKRPNCRGSFGSRKKQKLPGGRAMVSDARQLEANSTTLDSPNDKHSFHPVDLAWSKTSEDSMFTSKAVTGIPRVSSVISCPRANTAFPAVEQSEQDAALQKTVLAEEGEMAGGGSNEESMEFDACCSSANSQVHGREMVVYSRRDNVCDCSIPPLLRPVQRSFSPVDAKIEDMIRKSRIRATVLSMQELRKRDEREDAAGDDRPSDTMDVEMLG